MKKIVIVGGGPAGLFLASKLCEKEVDIHIYDQNKAVGKKFLVAGKSDLNITHSENIESLSNWYFKDKNFFKSLFEEFSNDDLRKWLKDFLEVETFVGSSGRVFPKDIKASQILKNWTDKLKLLGVTFHLGARLTEIKANSIVFNHEDEVIADNFIYALGGSSWKITGSDGKWTELFEAHGIKCNPFIASNCGVKVDFSDFFKNKFQFSHIKNVRVSSCEKEVQGDIVISEEGFEGTPIYSLSKEILETKKVSINFKPDLDVNELKKRIENRNRKKGLSSFLVKDLSLAKSVLSLLRELHSLEYIESNLFSIITDFVINDVSLGDIDRAISTMGGVDMDEVESSLELKKLQNHFIMGEMLDWNTITGGYLLQACFSMGYRVFVSI